MAQAAVTCPGCSNTIEVPANYMNASIRCPACGGTVACAASAPRESAPWEHRPAARPAMPAPAQQPQGQPSQYQLPIRAQQAAQQPAPFRAAAPQNVYPAQYGTPAPAYPAYGMQAPAPAKSPAVKIILIVVGVVLGIGLISGLGAVILGASGVAGEDVNSWMLYQSPAGQYSVRMPVQPVETSKPDVTGAGPTTIFSADALYKRRNFAVAYFDLGPGSPDEYTFDYTEAVFGINSLYGGKVVQQGPTTVAGLTGYEAKIQQKQPGFINKLRMFRVGNRVYLVMVEAYRDSEDGVVEDFLNTFRVTQ